MSTQPRGPRRREVLLGAAALGVGTAAGAGGVHLAHLADGADAPTPLGQQTRTAEGSAHPPAVGAESAHAVFIGLDLADGVDRNRIEAMLRLLSEDAARLSAGRAPIGDQEPHLAALPANLSVTFGFGPGFVQRVNPAARPDWLQQMPPFPIDRLEDRWSEGHLLLLVTGDDQLSVAHAQRMLLKDARAYTTIRWQQQGFRNAHGVQDPSTTQRNLFGQLDGTGNAKPGSDEFNRIVWVTDDGWMQGGTTLVLRRISMDLETWDAVDPPGRDAAIGRRFTDGAPLTGDHEYDEPDFEALTPQGFTVINPASHVRRAKSDDPTQRIFRQPYNYDIPVSPGPGETAVGGIGATVSNSGLLFASFQANPMRQFLPIQQRLAEVDLLNQWTTPIGSAVFAIPPLGGAFVGEALFRA